MKNLHKAYYRDYFDNLNFGYLLGVGQEPITEIKMRNRDLTCSDLLQTIDRNPLVKDYHFELKISYPGLVTGVGINHEAKIEGEFKLGVHFDYTYGMPVVYGSSVKGVLRHAFEDGYVDAQMIKDANNHWKEKNKSVQDKDLIPSWVGESANFKSIVADIFEGGGKSIYNRDIFFDAVITEADSKRRILCSDSITPHGANPLKNPTPITFLKIAPGCTMEFRFKLVDSEIDGKKFSADQKKALFEEIIKTVGVGAKTNVGYGQFE